MNDRKDARTETVPNAQAPPSRAMEAAQRRAFQTRARKWDDNQNVQKQPSDFKSDGFSLPPPDGRTDLNESTSMHSRAVEIAQRQVFQTRTRKWNEPQSVKQQLADPVSAGCSSAQDGPAGPEEPIQAVPALNPARRRHACTMRANANQLNRQKAAKNGRAPSALSQFAQNTGDAVAQQDEEDGKTVQDGGNEIAGKLKEQVGRETAKKRGKANAKRRAARQIRKRQAEVLAGKAGAAGAADAETGLNLTGKAARLARRLFRALGIKGKAIFIIVFVILIIVICMMSEANSFTPLVNGLGILSSVTFQASDADIDQAEAYYCGLENGLRQQISQIPQKYPGYGNYLYEVDDIGHVPMYLIAYLSADYGNFHFSEIKPALDALFSQQVHLTLTVQPPAGNSSSNAAATSSGQPAGKPSLLIRLDAQDFTQMVTPLLSQKNATSVYQAYLQVRGNRQYFHNPLPFDWAMYTTLTVDNTAELDIQAGVPVKSGIAGTVQDASDGSVTIAGSDGLKMTASGLSQLRVGAGQAVGVGTLLGVTGKGLSLHFSRSGENLNPLIFADAGKLTETGSVTVGGQPLGGSVAGYQSAVSQLAGQYGMTPYVPLILAVMQQESGGRGGDPMQAAEGPFNTRYPKCPNGITDPVYSLQCGIQELQQCVQLAGCKGPSDLPGISLALQGYNFGQGYISWAKEHGGYSLLGAQAFSSTEAAQLGWSGYGDPYYVPHVLRYYTAS